MNDKTYKYAGKIFDNKPTFFNKETQKIYTASIKTLKETNPLRAFTIEKSKILGYLFIIALISCIYLDAVALNKSYIVTIVIFVLGTIIGGSINLINAKMMKEEYQPAKMQEIDIAKYDTKEIMQKLKKKFMLALALMSTFNILILLMMFLFYKQIFMHTSILVFWSIAVYGLYLVQLSAFPGISPLRQYLDSSQKN